MHHQITILDPDNAPAVAYRDGYGHLEADRPGGRAWAPLCNRWILDGGLRSFRNDPHHIGRSAAALKLVVFVAVRIHEAQSRDPEAPAAVSVPYKLVADATRLSHFLIHSAKTFLCDQRILRVAAEGGPGGLHYTLSRSDTSRTCGRILYRPVAASPARALRLLSCRTSLDLHALKIHLLLCALSCETGAAAPLTASLISDLANVPEARIPQAVSALMRRGMIASDDAGVSTNSDGGHYILRQLPL